MFDDRVVCVYCREFILCYGAVDGVAGFRESCKLLLPSSQLYKFSNAAELILFCNLC